MASRGILRAIIGNVLGVIALIHVARNVPLLLRGDLSSLETVVTLGGVAVVWWWLTWLIGGYRSGGRGTPADRSTEPDAGTSDSRGSVSPPIAVRSLTVVDRASRVSYRMLVIIAPLTMVAMIAIAMGLPLAYEAAAVLTAAFLLLSLLAAMHFIEQVADESCAHALRWHAGFAAPSSYDPRERSLIRAGLASFLAAATAWVVYLAVAF